MNDYLMDQDEPLENNWDTLTSPSVGIDLKELGGGSDVKCLKFCPGIEI